MYENTFITVTVKAIQTVIKDIYLYLKVDFQLHFSTMQEGATGLQFLYSLRFGLSRSPRFKFSPSFTENDEVPSVRTQAHL